MPEHPEKPTKTEASTPPVVGAEVGIQVYGKRTLFFRQSVAEGEFGGIPFELSLTLNGGAMLVQFRDDDQWYVFTPKALIEAAWSLRGKDQPVPAAPL